MDGIAAALLGLHRNASLPLVVSATSGEACVRWVRASTHWTTRPIPTSSVLACQRVHRGGPGAQVRLRSCRCLRRTSRRERGVMSEHWRRADGFQIASGVLGVATSPFLLAHGKPAAAFLLIAAGVALFATQLVIVLDLRLAALDTAQILLVAGGSTLVAVSVGVSHASGRRRAVVAPRLRGVGNAAHRVGSRDPGRRGCAVRAQLSPRSRLASPTDRDGSPQSEAKCRSGVPAFERGGADAGAGRVVGRSRPDRPWTRGAARHHREQFLRGLDGQRVGHRLHGATQGDDLDSTTIAANMKSRALRRPARTCRSRSPTRPRADTGTSPPTSSASCDAVTRFVAVSGRPRTARR